MDRADGNILFIRADGNPSLGMGHIMRCLSIADEMRGRIIFITACEECVDKIKERGYEALLLDTDYRHMETEIDTLVIILKKYCKPDMLCAMLVDSYQVSAAYINALRKYIRVACLEDMGNAYPADLLINYNIYAPSLADKYMPSGAEDKNVSIYPDRMLLGLAYQPLGREFGSGSIQISQSVTDVMITTGGSDPCYAAGAILEALLSEASGSLENITYHVVSGPFNQNAERLKCEYGDRDNVKIYEGLKSLRELMLRCDVAISATGSTIYELCALSVPIICFFFVPNQRQAAAALENMTDIVNAGDFSKEPLSVSQKIVTTLKKCVQDSGYRKHLAAQERKIVDAKGAGRLARELEKLMDYAKWGING